MPSPRLTSLPEFMQLEILTFLDIPDQRELLRVNTDFLPLWKKARIIELSAKDIVLRSRSEQINLASKVFNPYNQLEVYFTDLRNLGEYRLEIRQAYEKDFQEVKVGDESKDGNVEEHNFNEESLFNMVLKSWAFESLAFLEIDLLNLVSILEKTPLKKVKKLNIEFDRNDPLQRLEETFELLARKIGYGLELKHLHISALKSNPLENEDDPVTRSMVATIETGIQNLAAIPGLQSLNFTNCKFNSLRCFETFPSLNQLRFNLCTIPNEEIKYLDHIKNLSLLACFGITDILTLNNNQRITLMDFNISNFTKQSFQNTHSLRLNLGREETTINVGFYPNLRSLVLGGLGVRLELPSQLSSHLKRLTLSNLVFLDRLVLPPNRLSRLNIWSCKSLISVDGVGNINSIVLMYLDKLTSITQVDHGNKNMQIENCPKLQDFSFLKCCEKVSLIGCSFDDSSPFEVPALKEFEIRHCVNVKKIFSVNQTQGDAFQQLRSLKFSGHWKDLFHGGIIFHSVVELEINLDLDHNGPFDYSFFPNLNKIVFTSMQMKWEKHGRDSFFTSNGHLQFQRRPGKSSTTTYLKRLTPVDPTFAERLDEVKRREVFVKRIVDFGKIDKEKTKDYGFTEERLKVLEELLGDMLKPGIRPKVLEDIKAFSAPIF